MNLKTLHDELDTDPLARGYSGMSDAQAASDLNTVYRQKTQDVISGGTVYEQVDLAEFQALDTALKEEVWNIVGLGAEIFVSAGSKARERFIAIFGAGSQTIDNLQAYLTHDISRADELGLGHVRESDVCKARAL